MWNEAENRERDWGETREARAVSAHKTLTPRVTDFFTDLKEKTDCFAVYSSVITWIIIQLFPMFEQTTYSLFS